MDDLKTSMIKLAVERVVQFDGHRSKAARSLGVSIKWLRAKLKEAKLSGISVKEVKAGRKRGHKSDGDKANSNHGNKAES